MAQLVSPCYDVVVCFCNPSVEGVEVRILWDQWPANVAASSKLSERLGLKELSGEQLRKTPGINLWTRHA